MNKKFFPKFLACVYWRKRNSQVGVSFDLDDHDNIFKTDVGYFSKVVYLEWLSAYQPFNPAPGHLWLPETFLETLQGLGKGGVLKPLPLGGGVQDPPPFLWRKGFKL